MGGVYLFQTLKSKIILYFLFITIVPVLALSLFYYDKTNKIYEDNMINKAFDDIYYIKKGIDDKLLMAKGLTDGIYLNSNFNAILSNYN